jgi:hypothetical protein
MKPINDYTLQECLELLIHKGTLLGGEKATLIGKTPPFHLIDANGVRQIANRIYQLTRWIPVEERLPTFEDADKQDGCVDVWSSFEGVGFRKKLEYQLVKHTRCTHWQRINRPEGV